MELRKLYYKIGLGLAPHRLTVQFLDSVSLMLEQMGIRSHPERSLMPWSASMMLPHGGRGHYRTAHRMQLNTQLYGSASQAFGWMRGDCCCKPKRYPLASANPECCSRPRGNSLRTADFFEFFRGKGCTWAPWRPIRCDHTKLQEPH